MPMKVFLCILFCSVSLLCGAEFVFPVGQVEQDSPSLMLSRGDEAMKFSLYDNAVNYYQKYLDCLGEQSTPENFILGTGKLAEAYIAGGKYTEAESCLSGLQMDTVWKERRIADWINLLRAKILFNKKDFASCQVLLESISKDNASDSHYGESIILLADVYANQKKWEESIRCMEEFLKRGSFNAEIGFQVRQRLVNAKLAIGRLAEVNDLLGTMASGISLQPEYRLQYNMLCVRSYAEIGDFDKAVVTWQQIADSMPESASKEWWVVLWTLCSHLAEAGRFEQALDLLPMAEKMASSDTERLSAYWLNAECLEKIGRFNDARNVYGTMKKNFSKSDDYFRIVQKLAQLERQLKLYESASNNYLEIVSLATVTGDIKYHCSIMAAQCLRELNKLKQAADCFVSASSWGTTAKQKLSALMWAAEIASEIKEYSRAAALYKTVADTYKESEAADARFEQGNMQVKAEKLDAAIAVWETFLQEYPNHSRAEEAKLQMGITKFQAGKNETEKLAAIEGLLENAKACPDKKLSIDGYLEAYKAFEAIKQYLRGAEVLEEMIHRYRDDASILPSWHNCILLKFRLGLDSEAVELAAGFLERTGGTPMAANVYILLGDYYASLLNYKKALENYSKVHEPEYAASLVGPALYESAICSYNLKDFELAYSLLLTLKDNPEGKYALDDIMASQVLLLMGDVKSRQGNYTEAVSLFGEAIQKAPSAELRAIALGRRAEMLLARQETSQEMLLDAQVCLNKLLAEEKQTVSPEVRELAKLKLAKCLERLDDKDGALWQYQAIIVDYTARRDQGEVPVWRNYVESVFAAGELLRLKGDPESIQTAKLFYEDLANSDLPRSRDAAQLLAELSQK